ncbi:MAG: DNA-binding transcriptional regulator [Rhodoferax sp.]|nr:DNA-binding transcriptional regulator [Rhodoferax sp.]
MPDATLLDKDLQYKEVRGLTRGLNLIKALNRIPGGFASTSELARACGIHRTTAKRLLETLYSEGIVQPGGRDGQYHLTQEVRQLSEGYRGDRWIAEAAAPAMKASVKELLWPSDLATVEAGWMIVRESTHRWSMLSQHHAMPGQKMPLLNTALGRAYLAACNDDELDALLRYLDKHAQAMGIEPKDRLNVHQLIKETQQRGFALNQGEWSPESRFSAVAVPVISENRLLGALNLVFPKNAVTVDEMSQRYVPKLKELAQKIGAFSAGGPQH